jgi:hypothetical protein
MSIFLDLIQSLFIRGSMVAVALTLTVTMNNALYQKSQLNFAKGQVETVGDAIYGDLVQANYNNSHGDVFSNAYDQDIQFYGDIDNNGVTDQVRYYGVYDGGTGYWSLYRTLNGGVPLLMGKRFSSLTFQYYDAKGKITADLNRIKAVRVNLVENVEGATEGFTQVVKNFKIYPSNL